MITFYIKIETMPAPLDPRLNALATEIIDSAMKIHSLFGPGLLESAYQMCLAHELTIRGHAVRMELALPLEYEGLKLEKGYRIDMLVDDLIVVEIKVVDALHPVFTAQVLTYLKLSQKRLGLILNFQTVQLKDGIKRVVN